MCIQGFHWGLLYILQGIKPHTFEELATHVHDMELSIANRGDKNILISNVKNEKKKHVNVTLEESMVVNLALLKSSFKENGKKKLKSNKNMKGVN